MNFWKLFFRLLFRRPRPAIAALYWQLTRRRIRARNRLRAASSDLPFAYAAWIDLNETGRILAEDRNRLLEGWTTPPHFSVLIHAEGEEQMAQRSLESAKRQVYPNWDVTMLGSEPLSVAIGRAEGSFIVPLRAGDVLSEAALLRFAEAIRQKPDTTLLYGDEDSIGRNGTRTRPWFKPEWNEELFLAQDYLRSSVAIKRDAAKEAAAKGHEDLSALLLAVTSQNDKIVHVPHVLVHVGNGREGDVRRVETIRRHLEPRGATCEPGPYGSVKVQWPLPASLPLVSIIIPTKDKFELLSACMATLLQRTDYPNYEILVVDNGSVDGRTIDYLKSIGREPKVRVFAFDKPFNYSEINNFAAARSRGSYLCLLNNDTEVVQESWLSELMRYGTRPEIGAVGAKLLYSDGSIQHAGVVVGIGEAAGHAHRFLPSGERGYFGMPHFPQFVTAVTGACLLVEKSKFNAVGGLDQEAFAVAFNDVDLCLRLEAAGWRNVYVPHAVLIHHEHKSRGHDFEPAQVERYRRELANLQKRWGTKTYSDPLHNPNLDRHSEAYVLSL